MKLCLDRLISNDNLSCVMSNLGAKMYIAIVGKAAKSRIKVTKNCISAFYLVYSVKYPYTDRIKQMMSRLLAAGLRDKWINDYVRNVSSNEIFNTKQLLESISYDTSNPSRIVYWCYGYLLAFLIFLAELCVGYMKNLWNLRLIHSLVFSTNGLIMYVYVHISN